MTLADFMAYLKATVRDGGGQARLEARLFYADQAAYEVPGQFTFGSAQSTSTANLPRVEAA